jgi:uncharacterized protein (TIGR03083 family)
MRRPGQIAVTGRFPALRVHLLELLARLSPDDWARPTAARLWSVKDVAAHLLGGDLGILSRKRDGFRPRAVAAVSYGELVRLVNDSNEEWVAAARRMSPPLLQELLAFTGPRVEAHFASADPEAMGVPVSWAGPGPAPVWLDLAREFTERWHHQQQIRDATANAPLYDPYFLGPVLHTFVRALPHGFRRASAPEGTAVRFEIPGESGGVWFVVRAARAWDLTLESDTPPAAEVALPQEAAWRLFTKGVDGAAARRVATVRGDPVLAEPIFRTVAVIG